MPELPLRIVDQPGVDRHLATRKGKAMMRAVLVILAAAVIGTAAGLTIYAAWPRPVPSGPSQQTCQFLRWEYKQLWPDGGAPPLPAGC